MSRKKWGIFFLAALALIIAAAIIVISIIMPLVSKGHAQPGSSVPPESSAPVTQESETPGPDSMRETSVSRPLGVSLALGCCDMGWPSLP